MNELIIIGNVGKVFDVRHTPSGQTVASFTIASNRNINKSDGSKVKVTTWFTASGWNGLADVIAKYVKVGRKLYIRGVLAPEVRIWTDQDNKPRANYELTIRDLQFLDSAPDSKEQVESNELPPTEDIPF
jgi:single-strand DNA-binding protein